MELFRVIRHDARSAMRFCGGRAIASIMIVALAYLAINLTETVLLFVFAGSDFLYSDYLTLIENSPEFLAITFGAAIVYLLVMPALLLGYSKLYLSFAEGKDESISMIFDMFSSFKKFFGSFVFSVLYCARHIIVFLISLLPGAGLLYLAETYIPDGNRTVELLKICACCVAVALMILCCALALIFVQRWALAPYYRASGTSVHRSFVLSVKATKKFCTVLLRFRLSFLPWAAVSLLILPLIWTVPYYFLSEAIFSKYLMERYERSLAEIPGLDDDEIIGQEAD